MSCLFSCLLLQGHIQGCKHKSFHCDKMNDHVVTKSTRHSKENDRRCSSAIEWVLCALSCSLNPTIHSMLLLPRVFIKGVRVALCANLNPRIRHPPQHPSKSVSKLSRCLYSHKLKMQRSSRLDRRRVMRTFGDRPAVLKRLSHHMKENFFRHTSLALVAIPVMHAWKPRLFWGVFPRVQRKRFESRSDLSIKPTCTSWFLMDHFIDMFTFE